MLAIVVSKIQKSCEKTTEMDMGEIRLKESDEMKNGTECIPLSTMLYQLRAQKIIFFKLTVLFNDPKKVRISSFYSWTCFINKVQLATWNVVKHHLATRVKSRCVIFSPVTTVLYA